MGAHAAKCSSRRHQPCVSECVQERTGSPGARPKEVVVVKSFMLGAVTGGAIVWFWGREIRGFIDERTLGIRQSLSARLQAAADTLQATADTLHSAKATIESGLGGA
jgi:hypothetical protein